MDATLFGYLGLDLDEAGDRARALVVRCRGSGSDAVLCYHNSTLAGARHRSHYRALIRDLTTSSRGVTQ
jgi:hypothetical protein